MEKDDPCSNRLQFDKWRIEKDTFLLSKEAKQKLLLYCGVKEKSTQKELYVLDNNLVYWQQIFKPEYSHLYAMFRV